MLEINDFGLEPAEEQKIWQIVNVYYDKELGFPKCKIALADYLTSNGITDTVALEYAESISDNIKRQKTIRSGVEVFYRVMRPSENYTVKGWTLKDYFLNLGLSNPLTDDELRYAENYFCMLTGQHKYEFSS